MARRIPARRAYLVRDIPDALWRRVKATAAARGETVRAAILALLAIYVSRGDAGGGPGRS